MEFKEQYSEEEVEDLVNWFETHTYEQDIDIGNGIHFVNVDKALVMLCNIARHRRRNRNFDGQIYILFQLREQLIAQGKVLGERPAPAKGVTENKGE